MTINQVIKGMEAFYGWGQEIEAIQQLQVEHHAEIARLRAIFPKILSSLGSGGCTDDASVEFLEQIPDEVRLVIERLREQLRLVRDEVSGERIQTQLLRAELADTTETLADERNLCWL